MRQNHLRNNIGRRIERFSADYLWTDAAGVVEFWCKCSLYQMLAFGWQTNPNEHGQCHVTHLYIYVIMFIHLRLLQGFLNVLFRIQLCSTAALDKISTDIVRRAVFLQ